MTARLLDVGDGAVTIEFGSTVSAALVARVAAFEQAVDAARASGALAGVIEAREHLRAELEAAGTTTCPPNTLIGAFALGPVASRSSATTCESPWECLDCAWPTCWLLLKLPRRVRTNLDATPPAGHGLNNGSIAPMPEHENMAL